MATEQKDQTQEAQGGQALAPIDARLRVRDTPTMDWLMHRDGVEMSRNESGVVMWLPENLAEECHMTFASGQITTTDVNYRWVPSLVKLNEEEHTYPESGKRALTAKALHLLADASGIRWLEPIADDMGGTGVRYIARAQRRRSDGTWDPRSDAKTVRFSVLERKARRERQSSIEKSAAGDNDWAVRMLADPAKLEAELAKYVDDQMEHIDAKTLTKAMNRVIRLWLAIKSTYKPGEIAAKPFLCGGWVFAPDYTNPMVRELIELDRAASSTALFARASAAATRSLPAAHEVEVDRPALPAASPPQDRPVEDDTIDGAATPISAADEAAAYAPAEAADDPDAKPAKPGEPFVFKQGPYADGSIEDVLKSPEGTRYVANVAIGVTRDEARQRLLNWLSYSEGRLVRTEDLAAIAQRHIPDDDIPF